MILAGDEFGDVHDLDHTNWRLKMSDPVDWQRRDDWPNNRELWERVRELIGLRTSHPALTRNEVDLYYFHPTFDDNDGERVLAYCRSGGKSLGNANQVVVIANLGPRDYTDYHLPWHWPNPLRVQEIAPPTFHTDLNVFAGNGWASLSLAPFQVRVFTT
jgi:1,4-alpha-glucan branching enzyme